MNDTILAHWKMLLAIWFGINVVLLMPSPGKDGAPSNWIYKWVFTVLHTVAGALPRLIATLFPQFAKFLPYMSNGSDKPTQQ